MKRNNICAGFELNTTIMAQVEKVKDDRVIFLLQNNDKKMYSAWYHIHGERINPYQVFKKGDTVPVTILSVTLNKQTQQLNISVAPCSLPIDHFVAQHPMNCNVSGRITAINGNMMIVKLAQNVFCQAKRVPKSKTGMNVTCRLERYNPKRRILFASVI